jgi:hypothetical protein
MFEKARVNAQEQGGGRVEFCLSRQVNFDATFLTRPVV